MVLKYVKAILIIITWLNFMASLWYAVLFQNWAAISQAAIMLVAVTIIAAIGEGKKK